MRSSSVQNGPPRRSMTNSHASVAQMDYSKFTASPQSKWRFGLRTLLTITTVLCLLLPPSTALYQDYQKSRAREIPLITPLPLTLDYGPCAPEDRLPAEVEAQIKASILKTFCEEEDSKPLGSPID